MPEPLRILFVSGEYPPRVGGVGDHVVRLRAALGALGAVTFVATEAVHGHDIVGGVYATPAKPWGRQLFAIARLVRRLAPNVVHVQYQAGAFASPSQIALLPPLLRLAGFRGTLAITFHDLAEPYLFPKAGPLRRLAVDMLRRAAGVCLYVDANDRAAVSARVAGAWRKSRLVPAGPTIEPPDGLPARAELRARLGLPAGAFLVGFFGFRQPSKGLDTLAAALRAPELQTRVARLVLIGSGSATAGPRRAESSLPVSAFEGLDVLDTGALDAAAVSAWVTACDVLALPYRDGLSTRRGTFMVAVAHGVPVVTTRPQRPGLLEIRDGEVAMVPPDDAAALAAALCRVHDDVEYRRALATGARAVAERYSWRRIALQTIDAYGV